MAQTTKKRGTVNKQFKGVNNLLVECLRTVTDILKMYFLDM